jgi:protease YdgD
VLCTAFCVADDMIATASHCLFSHHKNAKLHLADFLFKLQPTDSSRSQYTKLAGNARNLSRQFIIAGTSNLSRKPPIGAARDWALARLEQPSCRGNSLPIARLGHDALVKAAAEHKVFQAAFHTDFGNWDIGYSRDCSIDRNYGSLTWQNIKQHFSEPQALILHSCDTGEASSGSPLLLDAPDGPAVVGINVGTYQQRDVTIRDGKIVSYSKFRTIANTAVASAAFARSVDLLHRAQVITLVGMLRQLGGLHRNGCPCSEDDRRKRGSSAGGDARSSPLSSGLALAGG